MIYSEIETYLKINDLEGLLTALNPTIEEVLVISDSMGQSVNYTSGDNVKANLGKLTSLYSTLSTAATLTATHKKEKETIKYNSIKIELEKTDKKPVAASIEREASAFVSMERRVRNIVEAYLDICKMAITNCQSLLKSLTQERFNGVQ